MSSLSSLTTRIGHAPGIHGRLFSTTHVLRRGSFFDLAGLGASREAQYLSREHRIPRTEFSATTHLIRSGEVDPSAPAPGATPSVAAARTGQAVAPSRIRDAELSQATKARDGLAMQLQVAREELAQTQRAYSRLRGKAKRLEAALILIPALISTVVFIGYQAYRESLEQLAWPWQRLSMPLGAQAREPVSEGQSSTRAYRDATIEEHALAESGLASLETRPSTSTSAGGSTLSGLFWARN